MIGRIYIEDHYTLLHTKYESFGPCGFGEEDFFYVFPNDPRRLEDGSKGTTFNNLNIHIDLKGPKEIILSALWVIHER